MLLQESQLKVCPFDSAAGAVVLNDYGKIVFGYEAVYIERHRRIKILNRKGRRERKGQTCVSKS